MPPTPAESRHPVRFVTAASLFDGHDVAINIMRRILQDAGAEVIHLGHNRSVREVVDAAIEEDAHGVAVSSYQGGHMEYFKYLRDMLNSRGAAHVRVFGGGGGVIVADEVRALEAYGIDKIFTPDDGRELGLDGMVDVMLKRCDVQASTNGKRASVDPDARVARALTAAEMNGTPSTRALPDREAPVVGLTGTGGAGKSTLTDEILRRFLVDFPHVRVAVLSVDPTRRRTGGALLGDRIRMNTLSHAAWAERAYMRSFATRQAHRATSESLSSAIRVCREQGFDLVFVETAGIGQSDTEISDLVDCSIYVMTPDFGAPTQLEKIGMLDVADFVALNKADHRGAVDALAHVQRQVQRNRRLFSMDLSEMPVYLTNAARFNDEGVTALYQSVRRHLTQSLGFADGSATPVTQLAAGTARSHEPIPASRQRYLADVAEAVRAYHASTASEVQLAREWGQLDGAIRLLTGESGDHAGGPSMIGRLTALRDERWHALSEASRSFLEGWEQTRQAFEQETLSYEVGGRALEATLATVSLSGTRIPRVALPSTEEAGELVRFARREALPGHFPYTAGVFPFKRRGEDPTRMFAGEGSPERTNKRFHLVSDGQPFKRLSTAFDSVTLYGADPAERPDIFGKIGNAGVSVCTLDDMKKLYSGFDLLNPATSVSMTINGPAPMLLAMFMHTAIDQQVERHLRETGELADALTRLASHSKRDGPKYVPFEEDDLPSGHNGDGLALLGTSGHELVELGLLDSEVYERISEETLRKVRGTVQADILKEDQAQNTCIFSTEFALRLMADVQQHFVDHGVKNYYSVSISGYHIAEAGANPITQLAFTLANGFTYVEYYLARGLQIDDFAPNLSFFFSNGLDAEYTVLGRVARRIWAVAMRDRYGASPRSQRLKYHIQTSGRSLHAKEIQYNDVRTTLQALIAVYDNCNSLHTNAYDEAITTPTEESVRRAIAIQLIVNRELGLTRNENPLQGSYIIDELTDLVEEAVLAEFERLSDRGGVLGAMESMYQRARIQEESLTYERLKHSGAIPVIGVNTFLQPTEKSEKSEQPTALMRSTAGEKQRQIQNLAAWQQRNAEKAPAAIRRLKETARTGGNVFSELLNTVLVCSLGQISDALYEVGGQYRRNM